MITNVFSYFSLLILFITAVLYCEKKLKLKLFKVIPGLTFIYFGGMIGATMHVWELTPQLSSFIGQLKYFLLPMMLFLLLLKNDIRDVFKLGPKLMGSFLAVTASILIGFVIVFIALKSRFDADAWQTFSILSSSWVGGSTNMAAAQAGLGVKDGSQALTYAFLMDNICASFWLVLLISLAPMREKFNKFSGANSDEVDKIITQIHATAAKNEDKRDYEFMDFMLTLGLGLGVAGIVLVLGKQVVNPGGLTGENILFGLRSFFSGSGWVVILATMFGILGSMTPLKKIKGTDHVGSVLLYVVVGLIATATDFSTIDMGQAAIYIVAGVLVLLFHLIVLLVLAKIFKLDLYICGIASQANVGGSVSAPILAGTYDEALIPAGLMMGIFGSAIGTVTALMLAKILMTL
ncbi:MULTISPECIES: DUF819 family protein [Psychrilyobacter]|uniref:DUF819 family protein n=1 Tax=Psychrilyobacter piezotolerans TaxID=2293438 RepID=A0ABX9KGS4_9FUSO|nr:MULTISPECIES: DUF819 family protein [Psychrilyobacter]MCS5420435.1 DUF819 family protein [Psychrilyobacter sp. S5]NDI78214.1 DUF819 domain-containing protein [Psychrilyobacter piezotolerans]RDE61223.1 DUF819 domain-containing protein [Psychrilyobacter sp. S5]REI40891.1 DUF819 family protein [Psychrilyobacter piezotolerans]